MFAYIEKEKVDRNKRSANFAALFHYILAWAGDSSSSFYHWNLVHLTLN